MSAADKDRTLVLHIGFGKTGTSALQQFFVDNEQKLAARDILYPATGRREQTAHHYLATAARPGGGTGFECDQPFEQQVEQLAEEVERRGLTTVLLSSEVFSGRLTWRLMSRLKPLFATIHVVMYLRRQDDLIMSSYQQWIKDSTFSLDYAEMAPLPYFFDESVDQWRAFLGKHPSRIIVRPYDVVQSGATTIFQDFMSSALGVNHIADWVYPDRTKSNPRMSEQVLEFKRRLNRITPADIATNLMGPLLEYSAASLKAKTAGDWDGSIFSPEQRRSMMASLFDKGNARIARDQFDREDGKLFTTPLPELDEAWCPPRLSEAEAADIGRYLLHLKIPGRRAQKVDELLAAALDAPDPIDAIIRTVVHKLYKRDISNHPPNDPDPVIPARLKEQIQERLAASKAA